MDQVAHFQLQFFQHALFLTQSFIDTTFLPLPLDDFAPGTVRLGEGKKKTKRSYSQHGLDDGFL